MEDRFSIQLTAKSTSGIEDETSDGEITITSANGIRIESAHFELERVELFDVMGRMVFRKDKIHNTTYLIDEGVLEKGFYLLKADTSQGSKSFKIIL